MKKPITSNILCRTITRNGVPLTFTEREVHDAWIGGHENGRSYRVDFSEITGGVMFPNVELYTSDDAEERLIAVTVDEDRVHIGVDVTETLMAIKQPPGNRRPAGPWTKVSEHMQRKVAEGKLLDGEAERLGLTTMPPGYELDVGHDDHGMSYTRWRHAKYGPGEDLHDECTPSTMRIVVAQDARKHYETTPEYSLEKELADKRYDAMRDVVDSLNRAVGGRMTDTAIRILHDALSAAELKGRRDWQEEYGNRVDDFLGQAKVTDDESRSLVHLHGRVSRFLGATEAPVPVLDACEKLAALAFAIRDVAPYKAIQYITYEEQQKTKPRR